MARSDVLAFATEERRIVDREEHAHRRFVDGDGFERFGILEIADRVADLEALDADQRANLAALDALHLGLGQPVEDHQVLDPGLDHRRAVALGQRDGHAGAKRSAGELSHRDPTHIGRIFERGDEQLGRPLLHFGRRDVVDDGIQQRRDVARALFPYIGHPALLGTAVDRHEIELFFGGFQREHQIEDLFVHLVGTAVRLVDLVDDDDRLLTQREGLLEHEPRLRHRSLERIDEQQHAVGHVEHAFHLAAEIGVARRVDDIDFVPAIIDRYVLGENGDTPFAFEVVVVQNQLAGFFVVSEKVALKNHLIDQRRLAVIDMGDNRNIAYFLHGMIFSGGKGTK